MKLFLKGERCSLPKCPMTRRDYPPGQHGQKNYRISDYGKQLKEKQKIRHIYGISETQLRNYFQKAAKSPASTIQKLFEILEMRLDNVVYRAGFANSRKQARQIISHGKILIDNKKVDISSFQVKPGQKITSKFKLLIGKNISRAAWLKWDQKNLTAAVERLPAENEYPPEIEGQAIVEYYSR